MYRHRLLDAGVDETVLADIEGKAGQEIDEATEAAKAGAPADVALVEKDVWADGSAAWRN
jgi:pyruvate dehydrogenase E1 component alpha subunit